MIPAAEQIQQIAQILQQDFDGMVAWKDALLIKSSPHNEIARLYGAAVSQTLDEVWLLDNEGEWYTLRETDRNVEYVTASVLQRLRYLKMFVKEQ